METTKVSSKWSMNNKNLVKGVMPHQMIGLPLRSVHYLTKMPILGMGNLPWSCWSGVSKIPPKQYRFLLLPLVYSKNLMVTLLLKTLHSSDTTLEVLEQLTWKPPSWKQALIVFEDAPQAEKGEKQSIVLPSCHSCKPQQWSVWQDVPSDAILTLLSWGKTTAI